MKTVRAGAATIPGLGLGTFRLRGDEAVAITERALAEGYRHIDTAQAYENEAEVGAGIAASSVPRDQVFLTTKIWPSDFAEADFLRAADASLKRLGTDYVDLLLLHWPSREVPVAETIGALAKVVAAGKARHAGVSNFTRAMFAEAEAVGAVPLVVNQVEYHPFLDQTAMQRFLAGRGAAIAAYCPLARGKVVDEPVLERIAGARGVTAGDIALAWILATPNAVAVPKTATPARLATNLQAAEIRLSPEEIAEIDALRSPQGRLVSPAGVAPEWD